MLKKSNHISFVSAPRRRFAFTGCLLLMAALVFLVPQLRYSRVAHSQDKKSRIQQDLKSVFTAYEDLRIDPEEARRQVRSGGRISLVTPSHRFDLQLELNDMRGPNYRAEQVLNGRPQELPKLPVATYKGTIDGLPGTDARLTIDGTRVEGMILAFNEIYFVEPALNYSAHADATDYLLYRADDVRSDLTRECPQTLKAQVSLAHELVSKYETSAAIQDAKVFSPFKLVEIATEADDEFVAALGGPTGANNEILNVLNQVDAIYRRDIGLTFSVVYQHTWGVEGSDPYTANGDGVAVLNEFTNYWNANIPNPRDVAHMWTGRSLGGPAGLAWQGVVCRAGAPSYGVSIRETIAPFRVGIPAHEIGHNFNANHSDGQPGCENSIMAATQTQANNLTFCPPSIDEITNYVNANSSCLSVPSASTIQFGAGAFRQDENHSSRVVTITVTRTSNSGAASVNYATADAAGVQSCMTVNSRASERCDYVTAVGTITFAAGELSKTFNISLIDDVWVEGNETFTVGLSNPTGATLANPSSATVTIIDNDSSQPTSNPIDGAEFFIRQQYRDFLGREPEPAGLQFYLNIMNGCHPSDTECIKYTRGALAANFFRSPEFGSKGLYVANLYNVALGQRAKTVAELSDSSKIERPTYAEFILDLASISTPNDDPTLTNQKKDQLAVNFLTRPAVINRIGYTPGMSNNAFVTKLEEIAGVTLSNRTQLINSGMTHPQLLRAIAEHTQVADKFYIPNFVTMEYIGYLRRSPEDCHQSSDAFNCGFIFQNRRFNELLPQLGSDLTQNFLVRGFIESPEYRQRFGPN